MLLFSHSDYSVFPLGHVLYRRGVGGPFGRVSLEDERYVPYLFPSKLMNWFWVCCVAVRFTDSPFILCQLLPLVFWMRSWTGFWQTSLSFSAIKQVCSDMLYLSTKADKPFFLSSKFVLLRVFWAGGIASAQSWAQWGLSQTVTLFTASWGFGGHCKTPQILGVFLLFSGLVGFARLCPGDQYEVQYTVIHFVLYFTTVSLW